MEHIYTFAEDIRQRHNGLDCQLIRAGGQTLIQLLRSNDTVVFDRNGRLLRILEHPATKERKVARDRKDNSLLELLAAI